jgi:hypothetical protein
VWIEEAVPPGGLRINPGGEVEVEVVTAGIAPDEVGRGGDEGGEAYDEWTE